MKILDYYFNTVLLEIEGESLRHANLSGALLIRAGLRGANLSGADLSGADLSGADLSGANLSDANLRDADLSGADLSGANLSDANLRDADLSDADLTDADLSGASLRNADLNYANLSGAKQRVIRIDGTRHQITAVDDMVLIGCLQNKLDTWLKHYAAIGNAEKFSEAEIAEYRAHLLHIANILAINPAKKTEVVAKD